MDGMGVLLLGFGFLGDCKPTSSSGRGGFRRMAPFDIPNSSSWSRRLRAMSDFDDLCPAGLMRKEERTDLSSHFEGNIDVEAKSVAHSPKGIGFD
ncbi:unnamed protein product [Cyprideis torosa]|uniref:Uncharacterized protein n=1 Tax=Cyprideis torosa TaxID=163714 RepID=A0A7R8WP52_9CRUS|nr:unnamed protein product [Cyprideis torosa]CAG0900361.1 unnamed protein product [Cyprideis torosa]